jgi:hypothetical protein
LHPGVLSDGWTPAITPATHPLPEERLIELAKQLLAKDNGVQVRGGRNLHNSVPIYHK